MSQQVSKLNPPEEIGATDGQAEPSWTFSKAALWIFAVVLLLPFMYLTSLALLLSAYVHGYRVPSRAFLKAYAAPSNVICKPSGAGHIYTRYFEFCVKVTKADYDNPGVRHDR